MATTTMHAPQTVGPMGGDDVSSIITSQSHARRRSRGTTAEEAAAIARRLESSQPTPAQCKQRILESHWVLQGADGASRPPVGSSHHHVRKKGTTREEAAAIAASMPVPDPDVVKSKLLQSQWEFGDGSVAGGAPLRVHTPRLTTKNEATQLAQRLPAQTPSEARARMLRGTWAAYPSTAPPSAGAPKQQGPHPAHHRRPRGMEGADTSSLKANMQHGDPAAFRQRTLGSQWSISGKPSARKSNRETLVPQQASRQQQRQPQQRARGGSIGSSGTSPTVPAADMLRVPTAAELRQRNRSSHFTLGDGSSSAPRRRDRAQSLGSRGSHGSQNSHGSGGGRAGRTSTPHGAINTASMQRTTWSLGSRQPATSTTSTTQRSRARQPPPVPQSSDPHDRQRRAQTFRQRNQRSQWTLGNYGSGSGTSGSSTSRRKRAAPPPPPVLPPQPSAQARKRQALSSTWTLG